MPNLWTGIRNKTCAQCGKDFRVRQGGNKFCTKTCSSKFFINKWKVWKPCRVCFVRFQAKYRNQRTCSKACAWFMRQAHIKEQTRNYSDTRRISLVNLKKQVFSAYGNECSCCGEKRIEFLTIDHIFGDGAEHRRVSSMVGRRIYGYLKQLGYPKDRYRLLCMNCNWSHGKFGYCPHEREKCPAAA